MSEQRKHVVHRELASGSLALDGGVREFAFALLEVEDTCFHGVFDGHFVDFDVDCLVETMDAVDSLFFDELDGVVSSRLINVVGT